MFALFGILLPLIAWLVESATHVCRNNFFDPLPTPLHSLLWLCIPLSNAWVLSLRQRQGPRRGLGVLCGVAQAVVIVYTLLFLPLLPISLFAIVFWGLGMCSLSPLLALPCCLTALRSVSQPTRPAGRGFGFLLGIFLLILAQWPEALTYWGLQLARNPQRQQQGIAWLRRYGHPDIMLKACYQKARWSSSLLGMAITLGNPPAPEEVQPLYYRVTGTPFNEMPPPLQLRGFGDDLDPDRGQGEVGQRSLIQLTESSFRAEVDETVSTVAWHWKLTFAGHSQAGQAEARCKVQLPPQAVVNDAYLWVGDKKRRTLIASRGKAKLAYEKVVETQRDPLLITTCGRDRVLVQCFPVPPGGEMSLELTLTAPLLNDSQGFAWLQLPAISERNFSLRAPHRLQAPGMPARVGALSLTHRPIAARLPRPPVQQWSCADGKAFTQARWTSSPQAARPLCIVIDGSASMQPYRPVLAQALRAYRSSQPVSVLLAGDQELTLLPAGPAQPERLEEAARALLNAPLVGGQDNLAALTAADPQATVLWLHAGQPQPCDASALLPQADNLLSFSCRQAPNTLAEQLNLREVPRLGSLASDLQHQLAVLGGQAAPYARLELSRSNKAQTFHSHSPHLNALWAHQQCQILPHPEALKLAQQYHLVTPDTGAVVLENEEQERQYGLLPAGEMPIVPEPATVLLLSTLAAWMLWQRPRS